METDLEEFSSTVLVDVDPPLLPSPVVPPHRCRCRVLFDPFSCNCRQTTGPLRVRSLRPQTVDPPSIWKTIGEAISRRSAQSCALTTTSGVAFIVILRFHGTLLAFRRGPTQCSSVHGSPVDKRIEHGLNKKSSRRVSAVRLQLNIPAPVWLRRNGLKPMDA